MGMLYSFIKKHLNGTLNACSVTRTGLAVGDGLFVIVINSISVPRKLVSTLCGMSVPTGVSSDGTIILSETRPA